MVRVAEAFEARHPMTGSARFFVRIEGSRVELHSRNSKSLVALARSAAPAGWPLEQGGPIVHTRRDIFHRVFVFQEVR